MLNEKITEEIAELREIAEKVEAITELVTSRIRKPGGQKAREARREARGSSLNAVSLSTHSHVNIIVSC
jgi:hypothetical protein